MSEISPAWLARTLEEGRGKVVAYFLHADRRAVANRSLHGRRNLDDPKRAGALCNFGTRSAQAVRENSPGRPGAADDFSIDRYNASQQQKTRNLTPQELLEQYVEVRANAVEWVSGLSEEELVMEGRHPFLGQVQLVEMIKMLYLHNQIHFRDFRKLVE
jgi:hypothetical protein